MGTKVAKREAGEAGIFAKLGYTSDQISLIKDTVAKGTTDNELALFLHYCKSRGVDALDKMIYCIVRGKDKSRSCTFQASIDFLRSEAADSGEYDGQDEPEFGDPMVQEYIDVEWVKNKPINHERTMEVPSSCRVRVYRKEIARPFVGVAQWKEYYPGQKMGFKWRTMPTLMLAKCAEAVALRKAFPKGLAKLYAPEEMQMPTVEAEVVTPTESFTDSVKAKGNAPTTPAEAEIPDAVPPVENNPMHKEREALTVQDTLMCELDVYCEGNIEGMALVLKELTSFKGKDGNIKFMAIEDIAESSDSWAGKALNKLRKRVND